MHFDFNLMNMEKTKRLFLGVFIDSDLIDNKYEKIIYDFDNVAFGKWVEKENLHFTVKFLGDVEVDKIQLIKESISEQLNGFESELILKGFGTLPERGQPRVLYIKVDNQDNSLFTAQGIIEDCMSELGFDREARKFTPHITLLRIKSATNDFRNILGKYKTFELGAMKSYKIELIESRLTPSGPIYSII